METKGNISSFNIIRNISDNGVPDDTMTSYMTYKIGENVG